MELLAARDDGGHDRDTDAAAEIAREVVKGGGLIDFVAGKEGVGRGADGHEHEAEAESLKDTHPGRPCIGHLEIEAVSHDPIGSDGDEQACDDERTGAYPFEQSGGEDGEYGDGGSAGGDDQTCIGCGVAEEFLEVLG